MGINSADKPGKSVWFKIRIGLLLLVLLTVGGVLGYDHFMAKPHYKSSHEKLDTMFRETRGMIKVEGGRPAYTPEDVSAAIGKAPTETRLEGGGYVKIERYEWYRGTPAEIAWDDEGFGFRPFPKYFFEVVYRKKEDDSDPTFFLKEVSGQNAAAQQQLAKVEFEDHSGLELVRPSAPGAPSGGGGGGKSGGGGKKGGGKFNPEQIIERAFESDANDDGKLAKDEVEGRMADSFDRIDADKDGFVTKEELKTALERRGSGGGGKKSGKSGRPSKDDESGDKKENKSDESKTDQADEKKAEEKKADEKKVDSGDEKKEDKSVTKEDDKSEKKKDDK